MAVIEYPKPSQYAVMANYDFPGGRVLDTTNETFDRILSTFKFINPKSNLDTTAWKSYANKSVGYSITYPPNWILIKDFTGGEGDCPGQRFFTSPAKKSWLTICKVVNGNGFADQYVMENAQKNWKASGLNFSLNKSLGYKSIYSESHLYPPQYEFDALIENEFNTKILSFDFTSDVSETETNRQIFSQMLSTFKFTDTESTFSDSNYGFSFIHPKDFLITKDTTREDFYDNLATLKSKTIAIKVRAIHDIDIYSQASVESVAKREVMDSGFTYVVDSPTTYNYPTAIVALNATKPTLIATVSNPNKNLFIEISLSDNTLGSDISNISLLSNNILRTLKFPK